jgi:hypothetical protein
MSEKELIPKLLARYEKQKAYMKDYQKRTGFKQQREYLASHPELRMYHTAKSKAKKDGIQFSITKDDIIIPDVCPYMGWKLTNIQGCGRVRTNLSLDRIDPKKGYVPGNIQVISDLANKMKQNATPEQLLLFAEGIYRLHGGLPTSPDIDQAI